MAEDSPVTVVTSHVVSAAHVEDFRRWVHAVDAAAGSAEGHRGNVRLEQPDGLYHVIMQFDTREQLHRWEASPDHARLQAEGERFAIRRRQDASGTDSWFRIASDASAAKWRRALMTWVLIFPLLLLLNLATSAFPQVPQPLRLAVSSLLLTATLTWVILPRVSRWMRPWLLTDGSGGIRDPD